MVSHKETNSFLQGNNPYTTFGYLTKYILLPLFLLVISVEGAWGVDSVKRYYDGVDGAKLGSTKEAAISFAGQPIVYVTYSAGTWNTQNTNDNGRNNTNEGSAHTYTYNVYASNMEGENKIIDGFSLTKQPDIPTAGAYVIMEVERRGTMRIAYLKNDGVNFALLRVDDTTIEDYRFIEKGSGDNFSAVCEFKAEPGKKYYFFGNPQNFRFYGLSYEFEAKEWDFMQISRDLGLSDNYIDLWVESTATTTGGRYCKEPLDGLTLQYATSGSNHNSWMLRAPNMNAGLYNAGSGGRTFGILNLKSGNYIEIVTHKGQTNDNTSERITNSNVDAKSSTRNGDYLTYEYTLTSNNILSGTVGKNYSIMNIRVLQSESLPYFSPSYVTRILGINETSPMATLYRADGTVVSDATYTLVEGTSVEVSEDGKSYSLSGNVGRSIISAEVDGETVTLEIEVNMPNPSCTFADESEDIYKLYDDGQTFQNVATSNMPGSVITYTSSDESIATVDDEGTVTMTGKSGITTITANAAGVGMLSSVSASYRLNVNIDRRWLINDASFWTEKDRTTMNSWTQYINNGTPTEYYFQNLKSTSLDLGLDVVNGLKWYNNHSNSSNRVQANYGVDMRIFATGGVIIPSAKKDQVITFNLRAHTNNSENNPLTNLFNYTDGTDATTLLVPNSTGGTYIFKVKDDGDVMYKVDGNTFMYIRTIYLYTPPQSNATLDYNTGDDLPIGSSALPANIIYKDKYNDAIDGSLFGSFYDCTSSDPSVARVDANTGEVTGVAGGTVTINGKIRSLDPVNHADATFSVSVTVSSDATQTGTMVDVSQLMLMGTTNADGGGLDRTIPNLQLTFSGGNGVLTSADGTTLQMLNTGHIVVTPHYLPSHAENINFTAATLYFTDGTSQRFKPASSSETLDVTDIIGEVKKIGVEYKSTGTADPSTLLDGSKFATELNYGSSTYQLALGNVIDAIEPETTPKKLRGVVYSVSTGGHVTENGNLLTAESVGEETLSASFAGSDYLQSVSSTSCTLKVVEGDVNVVTLDMIDKLDIATTPKRDGFAFENDQVTPKVQLNEADVPSGYTVTYSTSDNTLAYPSSDGKTIITADGEGIVTVKATLTPADPSTSPILTADFHLQVLSGEWDFRTFRSSNFSYELVSVGDENDGNWKQNGNSRQRDTENYEYILVTKTDDSNYGEPLSMTMALQTRYKMRMQFSNTSPNYYGNMHLFGKGSKDNLARYEMGGQLKVPVKKGMMVEINANASGDDSEMELIGLTDTEGNPVERFYVNTTQESQYFLAADDGFFEIINSSGNLDLYIHWIKVSSNMVFEYGEETFALQGSTFKNRLLNENPNTTYSYEWKAIQTNDIVQSLSDDGTATLRTAQGEYAVTVTDNGAGKSATYKVHVVNMTMDEINKDVKSEPWVFNSTDLSAITNITSSSADMTADQMKKMVVYSIPEKKNSEYVRTMAVLTGVEGAQTLTVDGAVQVNMLATLGSVEVAFTVTVTGASLQVPSPVIYSNNATSYTIKTTMAASVSNFKFDIDKMKAGIMGDLKDKAGNITITQGKDTDDSPTCVITNLPGDGTGGVIPIYATYDLSPNTGIGLEGALTVAYQSHTWDFKRNMWGELAQWNTPAEDGLWAEGATFEKPVDDISYHLDDSKHWMFRRKIGGDRHDRVSTRPETAIIYYYNHSSEGLNALIIPETQGLQIQSTKSGMQLGVEMMSNRVDGVGIPNVPDDGKPYDIRNLMLKLGAKLIVPRVKPGQWIEIRWTRHEEDQGERMAMENLLDVNGTYISQTYKITHCQYLYQPTDGGYYTNPNNQSSYFFQVARGEQLKSDGVTVTTETVELYDDGTVDAVITVSDNIYVSIQQIILHEPGWEYDSSMSDAPSGSLNGGTSKKLPLQLVGTGSEQTMVFGNTASQDAVGGPGEWEITFDNEGTLVAEKGGTEIKDKPGHYAENSAWLKYTSGWGKAYVTLTSFSQNKKYLAGRNTWVITFGEQPKQEYPYTWDFTKYLSQTKGQVESANDGSTVEDSYYAAFDGKNPTGAHEYRQVTDTWENVEESGEATDKNKINTTGYNTRKYQSYFVDGAQLVSPAVPNGILPETAGLGFALNDKEHGGLTLDMQATVTPPDNSDNGNGGGGSAPSRRRASKRAYTLTGDGEGHVTLTGGGTVTIPKPSDDFTKYYIYVKSSSKPDAVVNAIYQDGSESKITDAATGVYEYIPESNDDVKITFAGNVTIDLIGVTNILKPMSEVGGRAWATESRKVNIDPSLTHEFTQNDVRAFTVRYDSYDLNTATVALMELTDGYVRGGDSQVDGAQGVVLKLDALTNLTDGKVHKASGKHQVPLFYPAITTFASSDADFSPTTGNMMYPNVTESLQDSETQGGYTKFILTNIHWTYNTEHTLNQDEAEAYKAAEAAGFYRLHIWETTADADTRNTLAANTAYLCVPTAQLPTAVWANQTKTSGVRTFDSIGIRMDGIGEEQTTTIEPSGPVTFGVEGDDHDPWYTLKGIRLPAKPTSKGIYIHRGKKVFISGSAWR